MLAIFVPYSANNNTQEVNLRSFNSMAPFDVEDMVKGGGH